MKRLLSIVVLLAGCAHGPSSYSDMEIWYRDCRPYKFPSSLTVIAPQSPCATSRRRSEILGKETPWTRRSSRC